MSILDLALQLAGLPQKEIDDLKDRFVNPNKKAFTSLPEAAAYKGKRIKNKDTGEIFISNGESWEPEE